LPYHILSKPEDIASRVVVVGDPGRATFISRLLSDVRLVNDHRGLLTYTGTWKGESITVSTHGMGGPGAAIVFEELIELGARVLIRLGTTGAIKKEVKVGDYVIPSAAHYYHGGFLQEYFGDGCVSASPHYEVLSALVEEARKRGVKFWVSPVWSSDAFYGETPELYSKWASVGAVSVEMECAALFILSLMRGVKAGAILFVNGSNVEPEARILHKEEASNKMLKAAEIAFDAALRVRVD